ncbi:hypothetical protein RB195_004897 [Necator americanus]|uniref:Small EDRK-rich factor-like N-terminal domain-containing protein n=1 Tax=Necator americanus TaxID=51031 RepID=A0ABR1BK88_NECAM
MTRGNQRDLAREKNMKKLMEQKKKAGAGAREANAGLSTDARMSRDAEVMRLIRSKCKRLLLDSFMALGARCTILYWK